ncbi:MAG: IS200/IS605 family element transposase accessory protein TnpB [Moorea sp. SIO3I7]|uniref:RNA-guided endonuclease InsQ/TnpB family protein n=1 Tax=unclassified Moorena TaxID=2683338 RepID=UPI0013C15BBE|nr:MULTISPECIES: transposase [unclassified Moorena]NEN96182.1 IS200/IS605 family element transposase accessory protein TnpB [Moorena sp. SIO3I7]NEO07839.1 IS200/IS605 family element transposase accessory protein TnpB [Moorena sp. SIO3I8]NEO14013.1 IS200/IS605 family element transposase accessory protein TnpB [Moorena sp. SIO3E8]NEP22136.1 IS200/IS605 family element transposase accessory protein TnpB [Moorena sp. SIO3I6]NEQ00438.1 IS200/IS605 family element transposase accessory protein TnpB [M
MIVREAKLLNGSQSQYARLDSAIRTAQFIRNKAVRLWLDEPDVDKSRISRLCKELAQQFPFAKKLNSMARQASGERAWNSISSFYRRCREGAKNKGYPQFKKYSRSVEYKTSGWKLSEDCLTINFTDGFKAGRFSLFCNHQTREDLFRLKINRVRVVRRADGYYAQFCFDASRFEAGNYTGNVVGIDLGLKYFYKDQNDNSAIYPKYLRQAEKRIKKLQRRLSRKFVKGKKPQSNNYHKARIRLGKAHLKVQRQRKDWAVKLARCVVHSNDVVVYEDLKIQNMVRNHHLAKSISDASWYQFTQWLDYFGKVWDKTVIAVAPNYTSQDCSHCGHRVKKSLSTRTHQCPKCQTEICRDTNAALNILKKGMKILGIEWNTGTEGHSGTSEYSGTLEETTTSAVDGQPETVSGVAESRITVCENPAL